MKIDELTEGQTCLLREQLFMTRFDHGLGQWEFIGLNLTGVYLLHSEQLHLYPRLTDDIHPELLEQGRFDPSLNEVIPIQPGERPTTVVDGGLYVLRDQVFVARDEPEEGMYLVNTNRKSKPPVLHVNQRTGSINLTYQKDNDVFNIGVPTGFYVTDLIFINMREQTKAESRDNDIELDLDVWGNLGV